MKKIMTLVLAIVLLATLCLTGCQPADKPTDPTKGTVAPTNKPTETTEPQLEQKTVQIWLAGEGKQKDADKVWAAFNEMLKEYVPNTTVEFTIFPFGEYKEKFTQLIAAEEAVDIAWCGWTINKPSQIKEENILPLDDLIANYGSGIVEVLGEGAIEAHRYSDSKVYFIPSWQGMYGYRHACYVPTELAKLAGATWIEDTQKAMYNYTNNKASAANLNKVLDQWEIYLAAAQKAGKLGAGINHDRFGGFGYVQGIDYGAVKAGTHIFWGDDTFEYQFQWSNECTKAYLQRMATWYDKGYIREDIASVTGLHAPTEGKIDDNTLIVWMQTYNAEGDVTSTAASWGMDVTALPYTEGGSLIQGYDTGFVVPYCADEAERGFMVLNAIYKNPELYNLLVYGIEGEHYAKLDDGTILTPYEGANATTEHAYGIPRWVIGTCKLAYVNNGTDPEYYNKLAALESDPNTIVNPFLAYTNDGSKWEDVGPGITAVLNKYKNGMPIYTAGAAGWEAQWNAFQKELMDAGLQKFIDEHQIQIDAYVKANNITKWP